MKHLLFCCILWVTFCSVSDAAPPPSLQYLLRRADTVVRAKVIAADERSTTFQRIEQLRGKTEAEFTLSGEVLQVGAEFLLLSQGDLKYGPPRPVLGSPMRGQCCWCGWLARPVAQAGDDLPHIKELLEQSPYEPHIHD